MCFGAILTSYYGRATHEKTHNDALFVRDIWSSYIFSEDFEHQLTFHNTALRLVDDNENGVQDSLETISSYFINDIYTEKFAMFLKDLSNPVQK